MQIFICEVTGLKRDTPEIKSKLTIVQYWVTHILKV
jgi:hypothetical protein